MSDGIYVALSGAIAEQRVLDVVANNVANTSTTGYRADKVTFEQMVARAKQSPAPTNPPRIQPMFFVRVSQVATPAANGALRQTGNPLDLAIQGEGYFMVQTPRGARLTRAGAFVTDEEGVLRTTAGDLVLGDQEPPNGEIRIPQYARTVEVSRDGTVLADGAIVGRVRVVQAANPEALRKEGTNLFVLTGAAEAEPAENVDLVQGFIESANVNAVAGMNELITVNRSFDALQRVIQTFRQLDERAARDVGSRT